MSNGQQVNGDVADLKQLAAVCASGDTVEISGFAGRVSPPWRRLPCRRGAEKRADLCAAQPSLDGHFSGGVDAVFQLGKDSGMIASGSRIRIIALIRPNSLLKNSGFG
jgi:hypothetical protein